MTWFGLELFPSYTTGVRFFFRIISDERYYFLCRTYFAQVFSCIIPQADPPLLVGAVVDWNLSKDVLLFTGEIHMNNTVAIICSKMQN